MSSKKSRKTIANNDTTMTTAAYALSAIGPKTADIVKELAAVEKKAPLFAQPTKAIKELSNALSEKWSDEEAARIVLELAKAFQSGKSLDIFLLSRWVRAHDNANAVLDCMSIDPPQEMSIIRVLSRAGSQKLVFLATWRLEQKQVVLKKLIGDNASKILLRELQPHPLSMSHPNIIETHLLKNSAGESFLVEKRLPWVMDDTWRSQGIHEAANLLRDISSALYFLFAKNLVHGDIKPDNIGREGGRYILLDFGICRPADDFCEDTTATGSIRTRAPELLLGNGHSFKSDVWALGATVFNSLLGRFPLFEAGEKPPRISTPDERKEFEKILSDRAHNKWEEFVNVSDIPEHLRGILKDALEKDPEKRISAEDLLKKVNSELTGFLRHPSEDNSLSPLEEAEQLCQHLNNKDTLSLLPDARSEELKERLSYFSTIKIIPSDVKKRINAMYKGLKEVAST